MKVKCVFVFPSGVVAVTGEDGQQIGELQGMYNDVKDKILAAADEGTEFNGWPDFGYCGRSRQGKDRPT